MTSIRLETEGLKELTDMLKNIAPRSANSVMRNAVVDLARDTAKEIKSNAPRRTGRLRKSIKASRSKGERDLLESKVTITTGKDQKNDGFYWKFLEFGTTKMTARPFVVPGVESIRPQVPKLLRQHFGIRLEKELARLAKKAKKVSK
jgi:HK97 gp10 family phage protein